MASDVHQAHFAVLMSDEVQPYYRVDSRLDHNIVTSTTAVRSSLPIACDTGVNKLWVYFRDGLIIHLVLLERSRKVVLDQDIAVFGKLVQDLDACWILERQPNRLLITIYLTASD